MPGSTRARGDKTEALVVAQLSGRGLELIERNATQGGAEIDLIARTADGSTYVFIEVRGRSSEQHGRPVQSVDGRKRRQIIRAATTWLVQADLWERVAVRFDVVGVTHTNENAPTIEWIEDAFQTGR
ncbi:MAG: YraN family protein [Nannocystaceae bacterium]|nr:YraN family protein [Nannocystaceae bacterium]